MDTNSGNHDNDRQDLPHILKDSTASEDPNRVLHDPVFYDENSRRWPWIFRTGVILLSLFGIILILFITSLFALRFMPSPHLPRPQLVLDNGNPEPILTDRQRRQLGVKQYREKIRLDQLDEKAKKLQQERQRRAAEFIQKQQGISPVITGVPFKSPTFNPSKLLPAPVMNDAPPVVAGFYVNWEETSRASMHRNIKRLTHFIPEWLHIKSADSDFTDSNPNVLPFVDGRQPFDKGEITLLSRANSVPILPLINNYTKSKGQEEGVGGWDTRAVHQIISSPSARSVFIKHLRNWLLSERMQGINIDFEQIDVDDKANLVQFMKELYASLHPQGLLVTQDVELESDAYDMQALAKWNDWIVPMFYDQHEGDSEAGPVAGIDWTNKNLEKILKAVPPSKIVIAVGNHGYDWEAGQKTAADVTYQSAIITARENQPDADIHIDPSSLNPTFSYTDIHTDDKGKDVTNKHIVWMQDAVSVYNQLILAKKAHLRGSALWYLGAEDPSLWSFYNKTDWNSDWAQKVEEGALNKVSYGGEAQVDFEGDGELLEPLSPPSEGLRRITFNKKSGLITAEQYQKDPKTGSIMFPSSHVVRRYGGMDNSLNKEIVLSFDDGPNPDWTPRVLDILKKYHVPGCFFVVGRQAEAYPDLIKREWDEGHEIGNHSWSHPDLFRLSTEYRKLQLTTTQRVIQAITNHSTIMFRPPYGNDTEPETGKEVSPLETAAQLGYITVGQRNDPQDWRLYETLPGQDDTIDPTRPRTAEEIVRSVVDNRDVGSIVLLHDSGGDRELTLAALPQIITRLRALGYKFVSVSQLSGIPRAKLMPAVTGKDALLVGADRYVFDVTYLIQRVLTTLFILSIFLGISRIAIFLVLALIQHAKEKRRVFPVGIYPSVSVVIAAYNEEKVIVRTVNALLKSHYADLEIVVVDDGSADQTSEVVQESFASESRVRLIRKGNGGKASALYVGIQAARGEIIVSLDADTLFAPDTVERLTRHFVDPRVGAVSGNVRVGNTHDWKTAWANAKNPKIGTLRRFSIAVQAMVLTRWQSLEYITSQNFDRRGYDLLNCITVVPGAVGALRRTAVIEVGGYTSDTLAEDTDLTWKLRRKGWRIVNDNTALAYTEAPETLENLSKQRFRWAFGTLQCLWKHRAAVGHHGAFGWIAMPSLWLYQILFPVISPFMDIGMLWSIYAGSFRQFAAYFLVMFAIELMAAFIAIRMDKGNMRLLPWLFFQRLGYRQMMYYVILKSVFYAIRGGAVGWGKFERTGTARIG